MFNNLRVHFFLGLLVFLFSVELSAKDNSTTEFSDIYWGVSATRIRADVGGGFFNSRISLKTDFHAILGKELNDYIAVEARLGLGLGSSTKTFFDNIQLKRLLGGYVKFSAPWKVSPYALLGYSSVSIEVSDGFSSESDSETGFSQGLGLEFTLSKRSKLFIEYARLIEDSGEKVLGSSLGFTVKL